MTEKLSSGYRINRAGDDAAGLSISEKMRRQIRGLTQASTNSLDGISMAQSAEGAMQEIHEMLQRSNVLAVKAANGTYSDLERAMIDDELQQMKKAIDETAWNTVFNDINLFPQNGVSPYAAMSSQVYHYEIKYHLSDGVIEIGSSNADTTDVDQTGSTISSGSVLADHIANELLPNAISQILEAFPSLKTAAGSDTIDMALDLSVIDGPGSTLAYAQYSFYTTSGSRPISMLIKVDSADFDDEDTTSSGANAEMLESTIAHELMHTVMQYNLTDGMSGRAGDEFPDWFVEGTAQLAGGGFPTGWNNYLSYYAGKLSDETDTSRDTDIANYLKQFTVDNRPYGHGYLAAAYIGYLANGGGDVTAENIASGMDKVFADLIGGASFAEALMNNTGLTESDIDNLFATGDSDLVAFVRKLSYASIQQFRIDPTKVNIDLSSSSGGTGGTNGVDSVWIQTGTDAGVGMSINLYKMDSEALGLTSTSLRTMASAGNAINEVKLAMEGVSKVRSYYGAIQNRLEHTIANLNNVIENTTAAESAIRDTDMAKEMVTYSNMQILEQAGISMLSQANRQSEFVLNLLS